MQHSDKMLNQFLNVPSRTCFHLSLKHLPTRRERKRLLWAPPAPTTPVDAGGKTTLLQFEALRAESRCYLLTCQCTLPLPV